MFNILKLIKISLSNSTKFKIVRWVERILNYQAPSPLQFLKEERKIEVLQCTLIVREEALKYQDDLIVREFSKTLLKLGVVEIKTEEMEKFDPMFNDKVKSFRVNAKVSLLLPSRKYE